MRMQAYIVYLLFTGIFFAILGYFTGIIVSEVTNHDQQTRRFIFFKRTIVVHSPLYSTVIFGLGQLQRTMDLFSAKV